MQSRAAAIGSGRSTAGEPLGPGKRTLTEMLGDGAPPPNAQVQTSGDAQTADAADGQDRQGDQSDQSVQDGEIGELTADRIGTDPDDGPEVGPDVPPHDSGPGKQDIAAAGQQLPPEGSAEPGAAGAPPGAASPAAIAAPGDGGEPTAEVSAAITSAQTDARDGAAQAEADAAAYKADMAARRDRFENEQHATSLEQLKTMTPVDKRATLQELGYDAKAVKKLKDAELDGLIEGKLDTEQRKTRILGMDPDELAALSPAQKVQYLVDLGIDRGDLDKAGQAKATKLFDDVMAQAHVPGQHKVKIQIKGGLFGKSWVVSIQCDADGETDIAAQKEGGFFSKLWGWIKLALPVILTVLAPLTCGASLVALAVYQAVTAIRSGDWLGAVIGVAGALAGLGTFLNGIGAASSAFSNVAKVAGDVRNVAETAKTAVAAAKAKNAGSLIGALADGAAQFAESASDSASKFAATMERWSVRLHQWAGIASGGQKVIQGIEHGDPVAALGGAFEAASSAAGAKTDAGKALARDAKIAGFVASGKRALAARPPDYAAVTVAAIDIAGQLHADNRIDDASKIVAAASALKQAIAKGESDPGAVVAAALGLAQAVQTAKYDVDHPAEKDADGNPVADPDRDDIAKSYQRAGKIVSAARLALTAATARPRPNYVAALDAASQLVAELTENEQVDAAALVTAKLDAWTKAVNSKDAKAIAEASEQFAKAIDGMRTSILGDDGGDLPPLTTVTDGLPDGIGDPLAAPTLPAPTPANENAAPATDDDALPAEPAARTGGPSADDESTGEAGDQLRQQGGTSTGSSTSSSTGSLAEFGKPEFDISTLTDDKIEGTREYHALMDPAGTWQRDEHVTQAQALLACRLIVNELRQNHPIDFATQARTYVNEARFEGMWDAHPHQYKSDASQNMSSPQVFAAIGLPDLGNSCAIRISKMLNATGAPITVDRAAAAGISANRVWGVANPQKPGTKDYYVLTAGEMAQYLTTNFGPENAVFPASGKYATEAAFQAAFKTTIQPVIAQRKGIVVFDKIFRFSGTGHADLFDGELLSDAPGWYSCQQLRLWYIVVPD